MEVRSYPKLSVAIIGSGKIGTDLLIKTTKSPWLRCDLFIGRDPNSHGLTKARSLGIPVSDRSIDALDQMASPPQLIFDATSAEYHRRHAPRLLNAGIRAVDLTPARVGKLCVPALNADAILRAPNVNMVTCGGQASIPVIATLAQCIPGIRHVEVSSLLAEDSVGPGTLANIDDYYATTAGAIKAYSGIGSVDVQLVVEKSSWKPDMLTTIRASVGDCDMESVYAGLARCLGMVRTYVQGYHIVGTPRLHNGILEIMVSVRGAGDWIPSHAGNLDIINCAAIAVAEKYARFVLSADRQNAEPAAAEVPELRQATRYT